MPAAGESPPRFPLSSNGPFLAGCDAPYDDFSLLAGFRTSAAQDPGRTAVRDGAKAWTYGELESSSNRLARFLESKGVGPGVFVGLAIPRSADLVLAVFAVVKCGGAYVPLDPAYPQARIDRMSVVAKPAVVLSTEGHGGDGAVLIDGHSAEWRRFSDEPLDHPADGEAPVYCIFTSGSTGEPKGAVVNRRGFANLTGWYRDEFAFGASDRTLLVSAPGFDLTQKNFFSPLCAGGTLVVAPGGPFDAAALTRLIHEHRITVLNWTPSAFYALLEADPGALASLRLAVLGGEPILISKVGPWLQGAGSGAEIANTYGPTECTDICAFYRVNKDHIAGLETVPTGYPVPNVQLAVLDDALRPAGDTGELVIGGVGVGDGYLGDPARTAEKFIPNPAPDFFRSRSVYRTGDMVRILPGGVLDFIGRSDHQLKVRGFRIELGEIESVLASFPGVREAAVVVIGGGDVASLAAFVSPANIDIFNLSSYLRSRLPSHMVPSRLTGLDSLPLTPHGKLDRLSLAAALPPPAHHASPSFSGQTQSRIRSIWEEVLGFPVEDPDAAFFDLGGDSILLARVHAKVMAGFGRQLPITDLFAHPTIRSLARHLDGASGRGLSARERIARQRQAMAEGGPP